MRGLIILQPYLGAKVRHAEYRHERDFVEFRNRSTNLREVIALQAGAHHIPCRTCPMARDGDCDEFWPTCYEQPEALPSDWARSSVVGAATLVDCRPVATEDRWVIGCPLPFSGFAWVFTDLRVLDPIPCKPPRGAQTWFTVPPEVEAEIARRLEASHER